MCHVPPLDICHIYLHGTKNNDAAIALVNALILCHILNTLSFTALHKYKKDFSIQTGKEEASFYLLLAIVIRDPSHREHYSRHPQSRRRLCRHRCTTTLSPDVTRNGLRALASQTSHRLKLSSPDLNCLKRGRNQFQRRWIWCSSWCSN